MKRTRFLVTSLLSAGFVLPESLPAQSQAGAAAPPDDNPSGALQERFWQTHTVTLASHRSHSSHASHSSGYGGGGHYSHTSHRSSTTGYEPAYTPPVYSAPSPPPPPPSPPPASPRYNPLFSSDARAPAPPQDGLPALSGRTKRFASIVRRVQLGLMAQEFYAGPINGVVGPQLRAALRKFQMARGLDVTGTITPTTLDALMISSQ